jgi:hypothetical protein
MRWSAWAEKDRAGLVNLIGTPLPIHETGKDGQTKAKKYPPHLGILEEAWRVC